ncbi:hypothetical protein D3C71_774300 [compost metagenome]
MNLPERKNDSEEVFVNEVFSKDSSMFIRLRDLYLSVDYLSGEQDTFSIKPTNQDTIAMYYAMPETAEGQELKIISCELSDLKVEISYETSLSIHFAGEHFELTDWKHFTSEWRVLTENENSYLIPEITPEESKQFPHYTIAELKKKAVDDKLKGVYTQKEGIPIVGISRIFVRISGFKKKHYKRYLLVFEEPMGC